VSDEILVLEPDWTGSDEIVISRSNDNVVSELDSESDRMMISELDWIVDEFSEYNVDEPDKNESDEKEIDESWSDEDESDKSVVSESELDKKRFSKSESVFSRSACSFWLLTSQSSDIFIFSIFVYPSSSLIVIITL
jgi:hypothetical protein